MNESSDNLKPVDQAEFDLLVDGELDDERRRELLVRLDDESQGWRRCALTFLEAQSWKREFGALGSESPAKPAGVTSRRVLAPRQIVELILAVAAGMKFAFVANLVVVAIFLDW